MEGGREEGAGRQPVSLRKDTPETGNSEMVTSLCRGELRDMVVFTVDSFILFKCNIGMYNFLKINKEKTAGTVQNLIGLLVNLGR